MPEKRRKGNLTGRLYQCWAEKSRASFHLIVAMAAMMMYILAKMLDLPSMNKAANLLFAANMVLYLIQWNQNKLYQFSNLSRHVKGIPARKLRVINGVYLLSVLLLIAGTVLLIGMLPLQMLTDRIGNWLYLLISDVLGGLLGKSQNAEALKVSREARRPAGLMDGAGFLAGGPGSPSVGPWVMAAACAVGVVFLAVCVVYLYRALWKRMKWELDDEVVVLNKEEKVSSLAGGIRAVRSSFGHSTEERIRRVYKKYIRKRMKKGSIVLPSWTPREIEDAVGGQNAGAERWEIHELYERARYADHVVSAEDLERARRILKNP